MRLGVLRVGGEDGAVVRRRELPALALLGGLRPVEHRDPVVRLELERQRDGAVRLIERAPLDVHAGHAELAEGGLGELAGELLEPAPAVLAARLRVHREEARPRVEAAPRPPPRAPLPLEEDLVAPPLATASMAIIAREKGDEVRPWPAASRCARPDVAHAARSARASVEACFIESLPEVGSRCTALPARAKREASVTPSARLLASRRSTHAPSAAAGARWTTWRRSANARAGSRATPSPASGSIAASSNGPALPGETAIAFAAAVATTTSAASARVGSMPTAESVAHAMRSSAPHPASPHPNARVERERLVDRAEAAAEPGEEARGASSPATLGAGALRRGGAGTRARRRRPSRPT